MHPGFPVTGPTHALESKPGAFQLAIIGVLAMLLVWMATIGTASAHPILVPRPTKTLADRLLLSDVIVLAREDPERPFYYAAVETLKGDPGTGQIDLFMPSQVRRQLASNPELAVVVSREPDSDDWETLGVADSGYLEVVQRILSFEKYWTPSETDNRQRLQEFSTLLGHRDVRLHELAYLEIGRASYASIRKVGDDVPLERVRSMLDNPLYFEWRGLDVMLLGLSDEKQDQDRVYQEMDDRQRRFWDLNLAAWATAYLEIAGLEGIDQLTEWYMRDERRSREELRLITRALAGHANHNPEWRIPVIKSYRVLLDTHPDAAPDIAHDLIAWKRWDFTDRMHHLLPDILENDPLGAYKVELYLKSAQTGGLF